MSNKLVALLLVACLVTVEGQNISIKFGEKVVPPAECYRYCYAASLMPGIISGGLCKWRCDNFVMWESFDGSHARRHGPVGAPKASLAPAPYNHKA
ncbi:unnamed protein product [Lathyrus sativus]|nr:unnamed protein product [Lathyrus sativus]